MTVSNFKRGSLCNGISIPTTWEPMLTNALTAAQSGFNPATYSSNNNTAINFYAPPADFSLGATNIPDYGTLFALPDTKLKPNCPEMYMFDAKVCVYFSNGCMCTSYLGIKTTRP